MNSDSRGRFFRILILFLILILSSVAQNGRPSRFRDIADDVDALLMVDMSHFAGLVATGRTPTRCRTPTSSPPPPTKLPAGPRRHHPDQRRRHRKEDQLRGRPRTAGGPLEHIIAAKATALKMAAQPEFAQRQQRCLAGAHILAERLIQPDVTARGITVLTGGTDVHLVLVDLRDADLDGQQAEDRLAAVDITVNRNAVPFDPRPPMVTSGLRIGTAALASRGLSLEDFRTVADVVAQALIEPVDADLSPIRAQVHELAAHYPLYPERQQP